MSFSTTGLVPRHGGDEESRRGISVQISSAQLALKVGELTWMRARFVAAACEGGQHHQTA